MVLLETAEPPLRGDVSVQVGLDREQSIRALRGVLKSRCASICSAVGLIHSANSFLDICKVPAAVTLHKSYLHHSCLLIPVLIDQCYICPVLDSD